MRDPNNPAVIIRYLLDLDEIMTEHDKSDCFECKGANSGQNGVCQYKSVISVEIRTNQLKLGRMARIV